MVKSRMTAFLENLEMSGNLTAVREVSRKNLVRENCPWFTTSLGLCQCSVSCFGLILPFLEGFFS